MSGPRDVHDRESAQAALDEIALLVLDRESSQTVLQKVVDLVPRLLPHGAEASITLMRDDRATTAAFSGARALDLDETQYEQGLGPCIESAVGRQEIDIRDARTETRWPEYIPVFLDAGALSALAVPVPAAQFSAGLNVYASTADAFSDADRRTITRLADLAAVALTNLDTLSDARELAENLRAAMEFRSVIEQAKGMLIERHKVTADDAFRLLVQASSVTNTKLRELADRLVRTGEL